MLAETLTTQLIVKMYKIGDVLNKPRDLTMEISTKKKSKVLLRFFI